MGTGLKTGLKRPAAILLAVCLLFALLRFPARAAADDEISSGTCGIDEDSVSWILYKGGELVIMGSGDMMNYSYSTGSDAPWYSLRAEIRRVTVHNGVTSVGFGAFNGCENLTAVSLPRSVTWVGKYAFNGCTALTEFAVPATVTYLGAYCFCDCAALTAVTLPAGMGVVDHGAFDGCTALADVYFDGSREQWDDLPVGEYNDPLRAAAAHLRLASGKCGTAGSRAAWALYDNGELTLTGTGAMASFDPAGAPWYRYREQILRLRVGSGIRSLGDHAFRECASLTEITVSDGNPVCESIGGALFSKGGATLLRYPAGRSDEYYTVPDGVTAIGDGAFEKCAALTAVTLPDGLCSIGDDAFRLCAALTAAHLPASVTTVGRYAFSGCAHLTSVTLPEGLSAIPRGAFSGCTALVSVNVPQGVTSVGAYAFSRCIALDDVVLPDGAVAVDDFAFFGCDGLTRLRVPDSASRIGLFAFRACDALDNVYYAGTAEQWDTLSLAAGNEPLLAAALHTDSAALPAILPGDLNEDGIVSVKDVVLLLRYLAGGYGVTVRNAVADVDKNNEINIKDAVLIQRYIAGGYGVVLY